MPNEPSRTTKTERILSVYHLFSHCDEVSMKELINNLHGSKKTFSRDITILKKAGVQIRYSVKRQAFVVESWQHTKPDITGGKSDARYISKIRRLITCVDDMPNEDCDKWYSEFIPEASNRTMQRDFATLNAIGYEIKYERKVFNMHDAGYDVPINRYYLDKPKGAYSLLTFKPTRVEQNIV